jgi:hypothetical protein
VAPLLCLQICLWVVLFAGAGLFRAGPNGKSLATDFAVFSGAADALRHGANPYNFRVLYAYERRLMVRQHLPVTTNVQNVRAGNPPLFYRALGPVADLPFRTVAVVWIVSLLAVSGAGLLATLRFFGWSHWAIPLVVFLLMPQVVLGACYGNVHGIIFAAVAGGLLLAPRYPIASGTILSLGWLKPQLALPLVALIILFHAPRPLRVLSGFAAASLVELVVSLVAVGPAMMLKWLHGLVSWSHSVGSEPNLASLVGLYAGWASDTARTVLTSLILAAAVVLTACAWWAERGESSTPFVRVAWLWCLWFLAAPFAHFPDEILLGIPVVALLGRDAFRISQPAPAMALYLCFFSLALFPTTALSVNFLSLIVLVLTVFTFRFRGAHGYVAG